MFEHELDRHWKTVANTIRDGIMIVDEMGTIIYVNQAFEIITGYAKDEMIGRDCTVLNCDICERTRITKGRHWCQLFEFGKMSQRQCIFRHKNGGSIHALKNASVFHDDSGKVIGAVETVTDITALIEKDNRIAEYQREMRSQDTFHGIIGASRPMQKVFDLIANAAQSDAPVIILGESGTGKELVANAIHEISARSQGPFVKINCAALTESLLESELFGHVKGAYTGAVKDRAGRFETAHGGSIFLDEIGDLPLTTQVKLLRVLEEKIIERVGDNTPIPVDVRIISATNRDLHEMIGEREFREDFYFRINVIPIHLPPLRERIEDIPLLAESVFRTIRMKSGKNVTGISNETMSVLMNYAWPGNVRELISAFECACVTCQGATILPSHLPPNILMEKHTNLYSAKSPLNREEIKKIELLEVLEKTGGNQSQAAKLLGVTRVTVWNRMKRYGISAKKGITVDEPHTFKAAAS
ncbi:MAG: sigma 54-interacting transcriptional regulator [Desulfobacteraceae bacterium]|jgi:PAS domain S-box-containing protein